MKTKISHLGRSTVSVILAVMMLLSTMLIGTVSTVNAIVSGLSEIYFTPSENWKNDYANFRLNVQDSNDNWHNIKMTKVDENKPIYKGELDSKTTYKVVQFLRYDNDNAKQWNYSEKCSDIPSGMNYYTMTTGSYNAWNIDDNNGTWSYYSDSDPVADSVTLTANPTSVKAGKPVTLTPTVSGAKSNNLTYTYKKTSGGTATEEKNADNSLSVTPSEAGTYKYTVTVSAEGFSDVTSSDASFEVTEDASVVTDTRLISVLNGSKVMFYGGEAKNWEQTYFVAMNTQKTTDIADKADMRKIEKSLYQNSTTIDFQFGILCVPAGNYFMGHSGKQDWAPKLSANVVAGDAFVIYNKTINGFNEVAKDGGNLLLQSVSTGTKTATTTLSATKVATGDLLGVTTSTSAGSSSLGFANTFEYYVLNKTTNKFYKVTLSDGKLDTSAFTEEGEYEVKTVLKDTNGLYVLADSDKFVISNKAKYSVTFGSNDANMGKVSVSDGTNSYTTSPASVEEGKPVTFTATANEGYKFDGWYSDADCTTEIPGATDTTYTTTVTADTTVYAKFVAETYNITVKENTNCTVTVNDTAEYGSNVNVIVKAKDGYTVSGISVTNVNANDITGNEAEGYTFKMPASNVEITPNVVAVEVTAPKVTLNTVAGESTASISVKEDYPITASKEAGDAYSQITSTDFSVSGGVEGTDYTKTETFEGSGIYNFVALTKGTFTVTYTATATSINDNTKSTSATATLKITASYTATQQAYVDLETYVSSVKDTSADSYTEDSFTVFSAALTSAQALLTGLPAADATNASAYTNAKTALETAFKGLEKDVTYYISGRFENHDWNTDATDMPFTRVSGESNLYKYETHKSVADLSTQVHNVAGNYDAYQYFFITTGKGLNGTFYTGNSKNGNNFQDNTVAKKLTLTTRPSKDSATESADNLIVFNDLSDYSPNVVIYLDTSDKDNLKLYYSTEKYSVTVAEGVPATVGKTEFAKDETVTVTATPVTGEVLKSVTVVGEDDGALIETTVSGNTATFKMPAQNVKVTKVTFRTANKYTVKFSSSDDTNGTVSAEYKGAKFTSGTEVTEGDEVKFTATQNEGYTFTGWTVNGTSASTTNPYTITVNDNTTVTANFEKVTVTPSGYYLLCGTDATFKAGSYKSVPLYKNGENAYYADFDVAKNSIPKSKDYFIIFSTKEDTSGIIDTNDAKSIIINTDNNGKGFSLKDHSENVNVVGVQNTKNLRFAKVYIDSDDVTGFTININNLDLRSKKITYSAVPTFDVAPADTVEITAKDGTIRGTTATIADLGNTTIEVTTPEGKTLKATDSFSNKAQTVKKVPDKSTVKVTTTIDKSKTFAGVSGSGYYVKGFSINGIFGGVLSQSEGKSHDSDVYTFEFTVNQELYNETKLEITPVYFLKDDSNCVYFYIENYDSAKQIWGNTPSCYVYYGSGKTTLEALGYYPGQPMVDYNGSIFTQIPKSIDNGGTQVDITGMTLNNYVWDDVHSAYNGKNQREDNAQTYDYDDFVKIADSGVNAENIIYRFKYNEHNNVPGATLDTSDTDADGWEVFLDYQNYPTDIFGTRIGDEKLDYKDTNSVTSKDNCLSIISDGYQTNYIGQYATAWSIYKKTGEKVATIPSSALLYALDKTEKQMTDAIELGTTPGDFLPGKEDRDTYWETFKTLYEKYKGFYAQINFEAAIKQGPDVGNRLDGRWYYTKSSQDITGEIKIQYANTLDDYNKVGGFNEDTFETDSSIIGKTTGASAYFTDPVNKVRKLNTTADNTQDYKFEVTATPSTAAYTFVGWYRLIDGDYKAINPSNMNSLTGAVTRNSDVTLVARYIKTPGGSMTFQHSLYKGENAGGGKATTEIQVVVKNSEGELLYDSHKIPGTASIDKTKITELAKQQDLTVTVTLYTTTKNLYDFKGYYSAENTPVTKPFTDGFTKEVTGTRKEGLVTTSEYTFSFDKYYQKYASTLTAPDAGTVYYNFYSDITSIKVPYKVQFSYKDRMEKQKYYNKAGYVDPENTSSYTIVEDGNDVKVTLTDRFILTLAPYESNFTKNLTWDVTSISNSKTAFDSSNNKSIASAVVNSTQSNRTIHLNVFCDKNTNEPTSYNNENGHFEFFTRNNSPELPYGSVFYTEKTDGTYEYDITAPKTYKDNQFMYWAIYSDPECKNLVIKAYNSEGHFSYVAYDNCWIVPVYEESSTPSASVKKVYTTTQFMEVTRNQWTAENADSFTTGFDVDNMTTLNDFNKEYGEDKLYADFVLNFFYNGKQLSTFDPNSENVQAGVLIQRLDPDKNETSTGYITDLDYYANKKFTPEQLDDAKKDAIQKITTGNSVITSVKQQINNSRLDNKNRLQYYTRFNNVKDNSDYVFRLYTYIQYNDADGQPVVELSNPVYFTFYDIANK